MQEQLRKNKDFTRKEDEPAISELNRFLRPYELEKSLNDLLEKGTVNLSDVIDRLPERTEGGINPAHKELKDYYLAIPLKMRSKGVELAPEKLLSLLMDKLEFFRNLSEGLVRICNGRECDHFNACPFKDIVAENRTEDGIDCMVDKKVVQGAIEEYITPEDGNPKVDPRQPVMSTLFEQLVQLLVKQRRISMSLKLEGVVVDHSEILQDGETEFFESANQTEHPLMKSWSDTHKDIRKVLDKMGLTPEFLMRQDMWETEDERLNSEQRAEEIALENIKDSLEELHAEEQEKIDRGDEDADPDREQVLKEALQSSKKKLDHKKNE